MPIQDKTYNVKTDEFDIARKETRKQAFKDFGVKDDDESVTCFHVYPDKTKPGFMTVVWRRQTPD